MVINTLANKVSNKIADEAAMKIQSWWSKNKAKGKFDKGKFDKGSDEPPDDDSDPDDDDDSQVFIISFSTINMFYESFL